MINTPPFVPFDRQDSIQIGPCDETVPALVHNDTGIHQDPPEFVEDGSKEFKPDVKMINKSSSIDHGKTLNVLTGSLFMGPSNIHGVSSVKVIE